MEEEIITKLKRALGEPIEKECQVVYILAEARKLLERLGDKNNFSVLNFYSNWTLHPEIDRTSSIRPLLERIEETILKTQKYDPLIIMKMVNFDKFRSEIGTFLERFNIDNPFVNIKFWRDFRRTLVAILIDCPLKPNYGEITEFRFVKAPDKDDVSYEIKFKNHFPINGGWTFMNF